MRLANLVSVFLSISLLSPLLMADDDSDRARILLERGQIISIDHLLANIRQHGDWQILELELDEYHDRLIYEVELLDQQGTVHKLNYDAKTGQELTRH
tara:strand:+ start:175898 stop:176191 length:294 start_codon:yes stop_codon:yes gene_type:complete